MKKIRLDRLLMRHYQLDLKSAQALILAGKVTVDGQVESKVGTQINLEAVVEYKNQPNYVSRGGHKLAGAAAAMNIDFTAKTVLDVGSSTGGFTDYALQAGAKNVVALDVGYGLLDWKLRNNPRVVVWEKTNIRTLNSEQQALRVDIVTMDVSFISTRLIFPILVNLLKNDGGELLSLIKPQFEAKREEVGFGGIIREPAVHYQVLQKTINAAQNNGLIFVNACYSPIKGTKGNIEYFIYCRKQSSPGNPWPLEKLNAFLLDLTEQAHRDLGG